MTRPAAAIIDGATKAIDTILISLERNPSDPAAGAFRAAFRRKGTEIAEAGGNFTLHSVHELVCGVGDDRNERWAAELDAAWSGLQGWRS